MKWYLVFVFLFATMIEPAYAETVADRFGNTAGYIGLALVLIAGGYLIYQKREEKGQTHLHEKAIEEATELFAEAKHLNDKAWSENKETFDDIDKKWKDTNEVLNEAINKLL